MSESDFFLKQMNGVKPIKKNNKIEKEKSDIKNKIIQKKNKPIKKNTTIKYTEVVVKNSKFNLEHINIKKNIKNKSFTIDKKIDFHGINLLESEELFSNTIKECYNGGLRCLLFVTGKGLFKVKNNKEDSPPKLYHGVIRSAFTDWVTSNKFARQILSYEKASIEHGGDGAFYVYLRKKN